MLRIEKTCEISKVVRIKDNIFFVVTDTTPTYGFPHIFQISRLFKVMFSAKIREKVLEKYANLKAGGKPQSHEWTVLASIILEEQDQFSVVCLATGTKCVGTSSLSKEGFVVNDCHAEVLCKRAFTHYLISEIKIFQTRPAISIFKSCSGSSKLQLKEGVHFHMYISQSPCGYGSEYAEKEGKRKAVEISNAKQRNSKRVHLQEEIRDEDGVHHSGAKFDDSHVHLSTKPGRGDPSRSYSCSDKICVWNHVGLQGCLLSSLIDPVYLSSLVIGGEWDEVRMREALVDRVCVQLPKPFYKSNISLFRDDQPIAFSEREVMKALQGKAKLAACGSAIVWNYHGLDETLIAGRGVKLGTNVKKGITLKNASRISPKNLFLFYKEIDKVEGTYREAKERVKAYENAKKIVMGDGEMTLKGWKRKDRIYYDFTLLV